MIFVAIGLACLLIAAVIIATSQHRQIERIEIERVVDAATIRKLMAELSSSRAANSVLRGIIAKRPHC